MLVGCILVMMLCVATSWPSTSRQIIFTTKELARRGSYMQCIAGVAFKAGSHSRSATSLAARSFSSFGGNKGDAGTPRRAASSSTSSRFTTSKAPSSNRNNVEKSDRVTVDGFRINKCLPSLSRRAADDAVAAGRVTVNGKVVTSAGFRVSFNDEVKLDGKKQQWQPAAKAKLMSPENEFDEQAFLYLKYWKPIGVTCTSDPKDPSNIISQGNFNILPQRVFTVGRLDRDSSGLILLTSDGRVNAGFLHRSKSKEKVYEVTVDQPITNTQSQQLRDGIMITTPVQRDRGSGNFMTARTLRCEVSRTAKNRVTMTLIEGRNRQIRRMMEALGLSVTELHRISFAGITLKGLPRPGTWKELSTDEMNVIRGALDTFAASSTASSTRNASNIDEEDDD